jgi:AhpD family alkylhydroperoxidase
MSVVTELKPRIDYRKMAPDVMHAMLGLEECVRNSGLERSLLHLVKLRASQINGCAWCIDMHTKDARADGETEQRLYLVSAWQDASFFSDRERAALAWTEAVTLVSRDHASDEIYDYVRQQFTEKELIYLTLAVVAINGWNRFNVSMRTVVGDYHS